MSDLKELLKLAREVRAGKSRSYVQAAQQMSEAILSERLVGKSELAVAARDAAFWKEQTMRALCKCTTADCTRHGAFVAEDADRVLDAKREEKFK